jgi:glutathione peroxidase
MSRSTTEGTGMTTAYDFTAVDIDGRERALREFAGHPLLIVNVA